MLVVEVTTMISELNRTAGNVIEFAGDASRG